jgi:hypothetical protein
MTLRVPSKLSKLEVVILFRSKRDPSPNLKVRFRKTRGRGFVIPVSKSIKPIEPQKTQRQIKTRGHHENFN